MSCTLCRRPGHNVRTCDSLKASTPRPKRVRGGQGGTSPAEVYSLGPPEDTTPPPAAEVAYAAKHLTIESPPQPDEREVAITQEVTPLGELVPVEPDPLPRRRRGPNPCRICHRFGHYANNCLARLPPIADPRLAQLRARIAAGKYQPFALLRKAASR